ncbi:MAG: 50S ribosome-binding GTPase [archaeon]|nr:50S ribosome-binding GTPase [archaeon]
MLVRIGLVGKPNVGKSTFFSAATLAQVDIANYPFCTIGPNVGVAFVEARLPCACKSLREKLEDEGRLASMTPDDPRQGSLCEPRTGTCIGHRRSVPVALVDVAGLVPGASEGRGRGNAFLADLANCDVLIQVLDAAGTTDEEGQYLGGAASLEDASNRMEAEITFLENELDAWIGGLLNDGWNRGVRRVQAEGEKGLVSFIHERLSGLGATHSLVMQAMMHFREHRSVEGQPWDWGADVLQQLGQSLRLHLFPIVYAANKADLAPLGVFDRFVNRTIVPCMADMELALRRATESGLIHYRLGAGSFEVTSASSLSDAQQKALNHMHVKLQTMGGTGLARLLDTVLFDHLNRIVVYPVQDETHWVDGEGRVLPDAFVVPQGMHAKALANHVHTDLGAGFIRGVDGRTRRVVGADHELADGDVLKIHAKT